MDCFIRIQNVLLTSDSAPDPDVVVVHGNQQDFWSRHPKAADAALVFELAETSLARDRGKRCNYARVGIVQYWIINLANEAVEIYSQPEQTAGDYARHEVVPSRTAVTLLLPEVRLVILPFDTAIPAPAN